jgi:hypothetical protein
MSVDLSIAGSGWSEKMEADPFPAIDGVLLWRCVEQYLSEHRSMMHVRIGQSWVSATAFGKGVQAESWIR